MRVSITIEIDTALGKHERQKLSDLVRFLQQAAETDEPIVEEAIEPAKDHDRTEVEPDQLQRLKLLHERLTEKQQEVWDVFMNHSAPISASTLKTILPHLNKPGALPGVFRAMHRWTNQLGGEKVKCPFYQVKWTGSEGIYRGLWPEEVELLQSTAAR